VRARVLVYYLPYDNDLDRHADGVLDALERGLPAGDEVAVVALLDRAGDGGLERHTITRAGREVERLGGDRSSDPRMLVELLEHARRALPARRYAVVLAGHGGAEGRWAYDATDPVERWMSLADAAAAVRAFRARPEVVVDLLFMQQCGRAAMPTLSAFAGTADVVMASQTVVGAPNRYYGGMLAHLAVEPDADGETLARLIMNHETPDMYADYVAFRGDALDELPARVNAVLAPLFERPDLVPAGAGGTAAPIITYRYADEVHVDLVQWLDALSRANHADPAPVEELHRWLVEEAVVDRRVSPRHEQLGRHLCGVNIPLHA
jgi:hypothetical protein